jgi:Ca2+/H+ antiporter, TMEM165/GDT1 family
MEAFLVSLITVAAAEMGDRTSLVLAARYRRPWPILAGVFFATLANHALAGLVGIWFGEFLRPSLLNVVVGASMLVMALWTLRPDTLNDGTAGSRRGAFLATLIAFFIAEIGDR